MRLFKRKTVYADKMSLCNVYNKQGRELAHDCMMVTETINGSTQTKIVIPEDINEVELNIKLTVRIC